MGPNCLVQFEIGGATMWSTSMAISMVGCSDVAGLEIQMVCIARYWILAACLTPDLATTCMKLGTAEITMWLTPQAICTLDRETIALTTMEPGSL